MHKKYFKINYKIISIFNSITIKNIFYFFVPDKTNTLPIETPRHIDVGI